MKKFLFIFLSCLLFQQLTAQTIVKFDNGNNIIYKNLQGKTIVKNKKYTIAFTDTISSIGFVGTRKGEIVCINNAGKELFEVSSNPQLSPSMSFLRVHVLSLLNYHIN